MICLQALQMLRGEALSDFPPMPDVVPLDERHEFVRSMCERYGATYLVAERECEFRGWVRCEAAWHIAFRGVWGG